jgi:hypothetical protein
MRHGILRGPYFRPHPRPETIALGPTLEGLYAREARLELKLSVTVRESER